MRTRILHITLLCILGFSLSAQITISTGTYICPGDSVTLWHNIDSSSSTDTYNIATTTYLPEAYTGTNVTFDLFSGGADDNSSTAIDMGFTFCFWGNQYDECYVSPNGWVSFTEPTSAWAGDYDPSVTPDIGATIPKNCVFGPWRDWDPSVGGSGPVRYDTRGTAPYRRFVVSFDAIRMFSCTTLEGRFQFVFHETSNLIETHFDTISLCTTWVGGAGTHGLHNIGGTEAINVTGRNATAWSASDETTQFQPAGPTGLTIRWYDGAGNYIGNGDSIRVAPDSSQTYRVVASGAVCGDSVVLQRRIIVMDTISIETMPDSIVCDTAAVVLTATTTGEPIPAWSICGTNGTEGGGGIDSAKIGSGLTITSSPSPFYGLTNDLRMQMVYKASEMTAIDSGVITRLAINVRSKLSSHSYGNFTLKLKCVPDSCLSTAGGFIAGAETVWGPASYSTTLGWNLFTLDSTFNWNGRDNLLLEICYNGARSLFDQIETTTTSCNSVIWRADNVGDGCAFTSPLSQSAIRANLRVTRENFPPGDFNYCWTPGATLDDSTSATPVARPTEPTWYYVTIKGGPCVAMDSVFIDTFDCPDPLPVELLSFGAKKNGSKVDLHWTTSSEFNSDFFEVERSLDGRKFEKILKQKAAGFSNRTIQYQDQDIKPALGWNHYRLKSVDLDGSFEYSEIRSVEFDEGDNWSFYPNPLEEGSGLTIDLSGLSGNGPIELHLVDATGRLLLFKEFDESSASLPQHIEETKDLAKGVYFIRVVAADKGSVKKFVVDQ